MDIANDTDTNTKYTVKNSSGSGMAPHGPFPFRPEETEKWPVLEAGTAVPYPLHPKESCVVYFFVNGQGFTAVAGSDNDRVNLVHTGAAFRAEVRRVVQARPARPAKPTKPTKKLTKSSKPARAARAV